MTKILIVDDSVFSQRVTANLLKKHLSETEIHFANDGQAGLEKHDEIKPDYIFVDLLMPRLNGLDLITLLKEKNSSTRIIVVSADVQKSVRKTLEALDIMTFMNKPFDEEKALQICEMIRSNQGE